MKLRKGTKKLQKIIDNAKNIKSNGASVSHGDVCLTASLQNLFDNKWAEWYQVDEGKYVVFCAFTKITFESI